MYIIRKQSFIAYESPTQAYYNQMNRDIERIEELIAETPHYNTKTIKK